jgi:hypothetical protein
MLHHRNFIGIALATLLVAFVATSAPAVDRKSNDAHKNGTGSSTGLLVAGAAHDFGAAFSRDRDKCEDDDKDKGHGGVRSHNKGKHRPPCDDDDDDYDDDDCDGGGHGHGNGHGRGHHKPPKDCHPSPSR